MIPMTTRNTRPNPIRITEPRTGTLRPFCGAMKRSGRSRSWSTVTLIPLRSTVPVSLTTGFARTVCPRSVVNSMVSTTRLLRSSRVPL